MGFLSFLVPLIAIGLSFDAINGEFNRRTLSRVLAQPIYRDALLLGKFLAGLLYAGTGADGHLAVDHRHGDLRVRASRRAARRWRGRCVFLVATIFYGGIWLALAMVFSTVFRQPATAALAAIAVWMVFTFFWGIIAGLTTQALSPAQFETAQQVVAAADLERNIARMSPNTLYVEATIGMLNPAVRSFGLLLPSQMEGAIMGAPLPLAQSVLLIWPQLTCLIAATILLFAVAYLLFQRQEIRA